MKTDGIVLYLESVWKVFSVEDILKRLFRRRYLKDLPPYYRDGTVLFCIERSSSMYTGPLTDPSLCRRTFL